jgi:uncharacterized repeat protein (TIGR03803 family)
VADYLTRSVRRASGFVLEVKKGISIPDRRITVGKIRLCAVATLAAACVMTIIAVQSAQAQTENVLYSFTGGSDGGAPFAGLMDATGNFYGTTTYGGRIGDCPFQPCGVVFQLSKTGKETVLYNFCSQSNCVDGAVPDAGVIQDAEGNLYGTAREGGTHAAGVVFKLSKGKETVLHTFCSASNCADGVFPYAGVIQDAEGNLYGTTYEAGDLDCGNGHGCGTVFKLSKTGKFTVLHTFTGGLSNGPDGADPYGGLVRDAAGNLYGTTSAGGAYGYGTVFKLSKTGKETVLYSFCSQSEGCTDGANPYAGLIQDAAGNLYGTTYQGGNYTYGGGTVFKLSKTGKETVLHNFCRQSGCTEGKNPYAGVIQDAEGNLYGTTLNGGSGVYCGTDCGTVFKLSKTGKETVLYNFCSASNCADGASPYAGVIRDAKGNLYGTTYNGGTDGYGVVFKLTQ